MNISFLGFGWDSWLRDPLRDPVLKPSLINAASYVLSRFLG